MKEGKGKIEIQRKKWHPHLKKATCHFRIGKINKLSNWNKTIRCQCVATYLQSTETYHFSVDTVSYIPSHNRMACRLEAVRSGLLYASCI